jgi:HAD superfamily hydrolase (TIGR01509 family)
VLDHIWDHARDVDPDNARDLDPRRHRQVWDVTVSRAPGVDAELGDALYASMPAQWEPYDDTLPVLERLRAMGVRVVVLSNVGYDLAPVVERTGIAPLVDGLVMSQALGVVKPDPRIFQAALDRLGLPAAEVLMVGDAWRDDAAAAGLGIRSLVLPRTEGPVHGLELALRLAGGPSGG